jgi:hypothetical protein
MKIITEDDYDWQSGRDTRVKMSLCLVKYHSMKAYGRVEV